ncbi:MAG: hypothetical protein KJO11_10585 [Gemmatimonadetes bacterium]|nr:hypothetical protein [Gemmatimonadota bacterium]
MPSTRPPLRGSPPPRRRDHRHSARAGWALVAAFAAVATGACASGAPLVPGQSRGYVPSLVGQRVIVFPVQRNFGVDGDPTAEMAFALSGPGAGPEWLLPEDLERTLARSPALNAPLENLPVDVFLRAEVNRIGDPIYGVLRRIGAVTDASLALLPVAVRRGAPPTDSLGVATDGPVPVEYVAALVDVRSGRVLWFGVEAGQPGTDDDPRRLASAAEALALRLVPPRRGASSPEDGS